MLLSVISCKNITKSENTNEQQDDNSLINCPNNTTQYDTLIGSSDTTQQSLPLNKLKLRLEKDKYIVKTNKQLTTPLDIVLYDEHKVVILKDVATLKMFARSTIRDKRMKNTFPDFTVYEMKFKSKEDAEQVIRWHYSRNKNLKELKIVDKIFNKENKIYYFETRAEIFRDYINKYAELIQ